MNTSHPTIGKLLRSLRTANEWTLKEMSEQTGIPVSTLSKVEHDRLTLTYDKLMQITQRLNISMPELFAEQDTESQPAVTARRSIGRIDNAVCVETPNYDYFYMCPELRKKRMVPIVAKVWARSLQQFGELVRHAGEEYVYVLEGRITAHTEYYEPVDLDIGESIYIDSNMGHAFTVADGFEQALVIAVCSSGDEQLLEALLTRHKEDARELSASTSEDRGVRKAKEPSVER